ncbi:MAG: hypothetical protein C0418_04030 [Coriobacteriaceae bacterium]|nr:hypothetical protein [Coriobacteriaceae bacterium]
MSRPTLLPSTPVAEAAAEVLAAKAVPLFALEEAAAGGRDMDAVHDMRVASRRLRAALTVFRPYLPAKGRKRWGRLARTITRSLGAVRDADVFIAEFSALARNAKTADERVTLAYLLGRRHGERARDLAEMRRTLGSLDLAGGRSALLRFAASARGADTPLHELAAEILTTRLAALGAHLPDALTPENAQVQHAMRISAKRLRYAVETLRPCFDASAGDILAVLRALQDALGEMHDRDVFLAAVRQVAEDPDAAAAGVTAAGLAVVERRLVKERARHFATFADLITEHDAASLEAALDGALLPLPGGEA